MAENGILNITSLKEQVYEYIRQQMKNGAMRPGSLIDMTATAEKLGVSKTPLRDALIQLEMEGFVEILPRRGVKVNVLTIQDIKDIYQIVGSLESTAVLDAGERLNTAEVGHMRKLNERMVRALEKGNFDAYYTHNLDLHDIFLNLCSNHMLKRTVDTLKKRLYDFPRRVGFVKEWEEVSIQEHSRLIDLIAEKKYMQAADYVRDVHWSFHVQEKFINKYYAGIPEI